MNSLSQFVNCSDLRRQLFRYLLVGLINTLVGYGIILLFYYGFGFSLAAANVGGYGAGLTLSFIINRTWTFGGCGSISGSIIRFSVLVAVAFVLNLLITHGLLRSGVVFPAAQACGIIVYSALVFIGLKYVVFDPRH